MEPHYHGHPWDWANDLIGEVDVLERVICTVEYNLGLSKGDLNGEVTLLVR